MDVSQVHKIFENLSICFDNFEQVLKALNTFLNSKRTIFPRFYFLSNDELLLILSKSRNIHNVQPFLNKCFEGIQEIEITGDLDILSMNS